MVRFVILLEIFPTHVGEATDYNATHDTRLGTATLDWKLETLVRTATLDWEQRRTATLETGQVDFFP